VDNTIWIANSKENAKRILETANKFFNTQDIEINPQKTELLTIKKRNQNTPHSQPPQNSLKFETYRIEASKPNTPHRYLKIWISDSANHKHTVNLLMLWCETREFRQGFRQL
jgi:hypothetical protein